MNFDDDNSDSTTFATVQRAINIISTAMLIAGLCLVATLIVLVCCL